ncbi:unnamed protein product [marine sediment metagenome]|uniref:Uncharacterized protein n=1 Tax=marine sediment metagenome TaxID=412755 RepID=X1TVX0_9ZZZZ
MWVGASGIRIYVGSDNYYQSEQKRVIARSKISHRVVEYDS